MIYFVYYSFSLGEYHYIEDYKNVCNRKLKMFEEYDIICHCSPNFKTLLWRVPGAVLVTGESFGVTISNGMFSTFIENYDDDGYYSHLSFYTDERFAGKSMEVSCVCPDRKNVHQKTCKFTIEN